MLRRALSIFCAGAVWFVPPMWLMALGLLACAHTWGGRLAALCFLTAPVGLMILGMQPLLPSLRGRGWTSAGAGLLGLGLVAYGGAWALAPDGEALEGSAIRSVWLDGAHFRRGALANVVPEVDQFTLGSHLIQYVDRHVDGPQAARIRASFEAIYLEMREDPGFVVLGSQMPRAYLDRLGGHLYVYDPGGDAPRPVILFLHGSAGPFKGYQWVWRELAEAEGWAVVSPSYGFGHWFRDDGMDVVAQTLAWIEAQPELDGQRVVLAGLSNGGFGVTRAAAGLPGAFEAVVYLSPVIEPERMAEVAEGHHGPIRVLTGDADRRIPVGWVRQAVDALEAAGAEVRLDEAPGQDHFLFFTDRRWCLERVSAALRALDQARGGP
ncbi:MAG: dienelactone hydrolase family protein [Alphaproteobacteria bacterium]|nr:dienelactone hydrolase family protein [Alphaproteobacteria bacterium]